MMTLTFTFNFVIGTANAFWTSPEEKQKDLAMQLFKCSTKIEHVEATKVLCKIDDKECKKENSTKYFSIFEALSESDADLAKKMKDQNASLEDRLSACQEILRRAEVRKDKEKQEKVDSQERRSVEEKLEELREAHLDPKTDCWGTGKNQ